MGKFVYIEEVRMCLTCGKHVWYLNPDKVNIGLAEQTAVKGLRPAVWAGLLIVGKRQPYGQKQFKGVSKYLLNEFARRVHGVQILPDLDTSIEIIKRSRKLAVSWCDCNWLTGDGEKLYKCIALGYTAEEELKHPKRSREIGVDEAIEIVATWRRQKGAHQSIGWLWPNAATSWLCNCTLDTCVTFKVPELPWSKIPSFFVTEVDEDSCTGCGECVSWCAFKDAMTFEQVIGVPRIDPAKCQGCGLCIDNCPSGALRRVPRETYWDPRVGEVHLPGGLVSLESDI